MRHPFLVHHRNCRKRVQHWALTTRFGETSMARQPTTYQFDLFSNPHDAETAQMPQWQALPAETRRRLTKLMVRLILDHADGERVPEREEMRHDF
jgi:hypothetical protein